ncbi:integrin beta pat-3-like [Cydia amplana]|uniref:integrin beta pat-3-like n=1 Tax=Cydia amplana TaxID=1869771 RepID=UPI002FE6153D
MTIKMGLRCFLVLVFMIHFGCALECHNVFSVEKTTCDECIRCGGIWCSDPKEDKKCKNPLNALGDEWCPGHKEKAHVETIARDGLMFSPEYLEQVAEINSAKVTPLKINGYRPVKGIQQKPRYNVYNTTQPSGKSSVFVKLDMINNKLRVITTVKEGFCSQSSPKFEYVFVEVGMEGVEQKAVLKYVVPCGCGCSGAVVPADQEYCHGYGNLTCGACQCNDDRKGKFCEKKNCQDRGDVSTSCIGSSNTKDQCSGNGVCDECNKCQCYDEPTIQGSQYFDPDNDCKDLCTTINYSECHVDCLISNTEGPCEACGGHDFIQRWNETLLDQRDESDRKLWVNCSVNSEGRILVYWAMKINTFIYMMRNDQADSGALVKTAGGNVTIPVVIGVIAAIAAAVAAAVGYVMWKGQGALPAAGSNYANIEPEDSVGVNPLYKPPTSSFKNPMYAAKS